MVNRGQKGMKQNEILQERSKHALLLTYQKLKNDSTEKGHNLLQIVSLFRSMEVSMKKKWFIL